MKSTDIEQIQLIIQRVDFLSRKLEEIDKHDYTVGTAKWIDIRPVGTCSSYRLTGESAQHVTCAVRACIVNEINELKLQLHTLGVEC
jgi:hypothetical protein